MGILSFMLIFICLVSSAHAGSVSPEQIEAQVRQFVADGHFSITVGVDKMLANWEEAVKAEHRNAERSWRNALHIGDDHVIPVAVGVDKNTVKIGDAHVIPVDVKVESVVEKTPQVEPARIERSVEGTSVGTRRAAELEGVGRPEDPSVSDCWRALCRGIKSLWRGFVRKIIAIFNFLLRSFWQLPGILLGVVWRAAVIYLDVVIFVLKSQLIGTIFCLSVAFYIYFFALILVGQTPYWFQRALALIGGGTRRMLNWMMAPAAFDILDGMFVWIDDRMRQVANAVRGGPHALIAQGGYLRGVFTLPNFIMASFVAGLTLLMQQCWLILLICACVLPGSEAFEVFERVGGEVDENYLLGRYATLTDEFCIYSALFALGWWSLVAFVGWWFDERQEAGQPIAEDVMGGARVVGKIIKDVVVVAEGSGDDGNDGAVETKDSCIGDLVDMTALVGSEKDVLSSDLCDDCSLGQTYRSTTNGT